MLPRTLSRIEIESLGKLCTARLIRHGLIKKSDKEKVYSLIEGFFMFGNPNAKDETEAAQAEESEEGKVRDIRRAEAHISRWALDSAARQGEIAAMFLNPTTRQNEQDDHFAVVYAKGAASAALFFLGIYAEESEETRWISSPLPQNVVR
jgi:hypothetical protein